MKDKLSPENTFIILLPLNPKGASDPTLFEKFPEHARLIGFIIAEWSQVEYKMAALVALALKVPFQLVADMLYALDSSGARVHVMQAAMGHLKGEPAISEAEALFSEADSMRGQRNKFAHGLFGEGPNGELAILGVRKDSLGEVTLADLKHQYDRMKALSYRAGRLLATLTGIFQEPPQELDASASPPSTASGLTHPQAPPSPLAPPPPSEASQVEGTNPDVS